MKINSKKLLAMLLALVMSISCLVSPAMATSAEAQTSETHESHYVDGELVVETAEKDTTQVDILVSVEGETAFMQTSDLEIAMASMDSQRAELYAAQNSMEDVLGQSVEIEEYYSLVFNGFAFRGEAWMVDAINEMDGMSAIATPMLELVAPVADEENVDLSPAMSVSTGMVGAINVWDMGYTGKGTVVAVIDTGIKQTHEAFSVAPEGAKIDQEYLTKVFTQYGEMMHCKNTEGAYYSAKLPYNWDYFDGDCTPNHTSSPHGSHVAGIVAGNNGDDFKGIAPDAQIISLQIFNNAGGATVADMLSALEDCVYLGVDAINMSLSITAGFEHLSWLGMENVYPALEKAGVAICAAASNDSHSYAGTSYGNSSYVWQRRWLVTNPDNGLIGTPGTYAASFTVGNCKRVAMSAGGDYSKVEMHYSSSWGPTAGLKIKPDISAPGESIMSVDGKANKADDAYVANTGTSMAAPTVAGGVLLMKEHLRTLFPDATGKELYEMCYALLMSTTGQGKASVRHQGSGIMNLEAAAKTTAYLTTTEDTRPKLELDDNADGIFNISFKVHNFGKTEKTYGIGCTAITEKVTNFQYNGWQGAGGVDWARFLGVLPVLNETVTVPTISGTVRNIDHMVELLGDTTVVVAAGETATVNLTLKIKDNWLNDFRNTYPAGMYLEGWIKLTDKSEENAVNLSIPYLGFVGDWDHPAMFDEGWWWQEAYGQNNMAQLYGSGNKGGIYVGFGTGTREYGLGVNMYADGKGETYLADRNAISPNNDGYQDALNALEFSMLRQPRQVRVYLRDLQGNILKTLVNSKYSYRRDYWTNNNTNVGYGQYELDFDWSSLAENTTVELVAEAYLDRDEYVLENNRLGSFVVPVTVDLTAPAVTAIDGGIEILDTNYIAYYAIYADARRTEKVFEDGVFAMERGVKETYTTDMDKYFVSVADFAHNEAFYYVENGKAYCLDAEGFDHGRTIIAQSHFDMDGCEHQNFTESCRHFAWYAFNEDFMQMPVALTEVTTEVDNPGSEGNADIINLGQAADGTIYAATNQYLYTFDLETITVNRENPIKFWYADAIEGKTIFCKAFFVAPGTNDMYGVFEKLTTSLTNNQFCSINPETGELTLLWQVNNYQYPRYAIKDANTMIMWQRDHKLEEFDITTGEKLSSVSMGTKLSTGKAAFGQRGYTMPTLYDAQENCVYLAGAWSYTSVERWEQGGIIRYDYDEHKVEFFTPGSGAGLALYAPMILDKEEPEHICYTKEIVAPTCTTEGYTLKVCAECGMEEKENIVPALGHDYEAVVTEPTCTALGYTTYTCKNCGDSYKDNYTNTTEHRYGEWETVTAPTCNTKGQEKRTCECGAAEYRDTDKTGHNYETVVTAPTCTTLGYTTYTCTVCGDSYKSDFVETIDHKYAEEVTAPTCTEVGYTTYTCACGDSYKSDYVAPTGHTFGEWEVTKEATCTEKGEETRTCACGETETRATFKADHEMEEVVTAPTCTEVGYITHACANCDYNYITDLTQPTGHDYETAVTAPTCTEDGYTTYTCHCGETYVDDIVPATGHTFGEWVLTTEPGCEEAGIETRYCEDCDATETQEVAPVCPAEAFEDVDTKQWYHEGVCYVIRNGLMNGKSETVFAPTANLTRAELVTVLYRMAGSPSVEDLNNPFTDVVADTWYTDAVIWAYNAEVVKGISDTAFAPTANITREQIATILYRYAGAEEVEEDALANFADADKVNAWAVEAMNWAVSVGLINGMDETTLAPQGNATRAQIATILMRYCEG